MTACLAVVTAVAQPVYSLNVVGYINITLKPGFNLIADQLDAGAGNNFLDKLLPTGLPDGTMGYAYSGTKFNIATFYVVGADSMWDFGSATAADFPLAPGGGLFLRNPTTSDVTVTFVGEVKQGTLTTPIPVGFSIRSSQVPQAGVLSADTATVPPPPVVLGFPAANGDMIYKWDAVLQKYLIYTYYVVGADTMWDPAPPPVEVGDAFFVRKLVAVDWTRVFNVAP